MLIEELLDECLAVQAAGGDVDALLAAHPALRAEVETLLSLVQATGQLSPAVLPPSHRQRMWSRVRAAMAATPPAAAGAATGTADEPWLRALAGRLGVSVSDIRRSLGPLGAAQLGQYLGLPGYTGMFVAVGVLVRCIRVLGGREASL